MERHTTLFTPSMAFILSRFCYCSCGCCCCLVCVPSTSPSSGLGSAMWRSILMKCTKCSVIMHDCTLAAVPHTCLHTSFALSFTGSFRSEAWTYRSMELRD